MTHFYFYLILYCVLFNIQKVFKISKKVQSNSLIFSKFNLKAKLFKYCCHFLTELVNYLGSIPGRVIPKALKMVLDTSLLKTHQYKVRIKGKVEQSRERSNALPLQLGVVAIEKGASWLPSTTVRNYITWKYITWTSNFQSMILKWPEIILMESKGKN